MVRKMLISQVFLKALKALVYDCHLANLILKLFYFSKENPLVI